MPYNYAMKRQYGQPLYPPYELTPLESNHQDKKQIVPRWQDPQLLKHGAYLARIENYTGKALRISQVPLSPVKEHDEHYSFSLHEDEATELDMVPAENGVQSSKKLFVGPIIGSNEISSAEAFCFAIEDVQKPDTKKLLLVLRQIDYEVQKCVVFSYFHHKSLSKPECVETNVTFDRGKKIVTRINLYVDNLENAQLRATTSTFICS